jgi:hypothetical protein
MKLIRRLVISTLLLIVVAVAWYWWNWPRKVDMAQYAPAESLVYLECNNLPAVANSITASDVWREFGAMLGLRQSRRTDRWLALAASLGLGPAENVILSRAQVAIVMLSLDAAEQDRTLSIKPEGAIIIETHTSERRIRPAVEEVLKRFAERTYGETTLKRYREDADYFEWSPPAGDRRIVAAIDQSLLVVGNSKRAVQSCLQTRRGQRANLLSDPELQLMRTKADGLRGLTFGFISAGNATRLVSWGAPLLFGRGPGDSTLEQIITRSAGRVFGAIGWSSRASNGGIEDRFFFSLEPPIISRLQPVFKVGTPAGSLWRVLPDDVESITIYRSESPLRAWEALRSVASQLDALSAVVFGSVLKAALLPYGIEDPERFLKAVGPEVASVKLQQAADGSVLFAPILDRSTLEQMFKWQVTQPPRSENKVIMQHMEISDKRFAVAFIDDYFVIGPPDDVRFCLDARESGRTISDVDRLTRFTPNGSSSIVTYTSDNDRVRSFFSAIMAFQGGSLPASFLGDKSTLPYATTETSLADQGIERRTQSALGQFSTLLALLRRN